MNRLPDAAGMTSGNSSGRRRGSIRQRGGSLQVRVFAGQDPVIQRDRYLSETIKGTDRTAHRKAGKALTRLQADADRHRVPDTSVPLRHALAEWLGTAELEDTTRRTYTGYIERTILPAIGEVAIDRLTARTLETLYGDLRRCRMRCDRRPFIEHRIIREHDCAKAKCRPHVCRPMAASTVRQIHSVISATLSAAVRWEWIASNPARVAQRPRAKAPEPDPPRVADERGGWRTDGEKTIYDNRWVRLGLVDVEAPNGARWDYHVVHFGRIAIAMIVNEDDDTVLMLWRYRFATDQWGYELLGGLVEEGEDPAATAAREAVEESGWSPVGDPEKLISFEPLPGNVTAPVDVYLWRRAEQIGEPTDTEEVGRLEWVPLSRIPDLAGRGELLGSGAVVPLLYYLTTRRSS